MDLGLTQRTLAHRLGCWYQSVASWERDDSVPLARRWPSIEAVLGSGLVPDHNGLAGRMRAQRLRLGLTQAVLAARAVVDVGTIRNAESGRRSLNRTTREKLGRALGIELGAPPSY